MQAYFDIFYDITEISKAFIRTSKDKMENALVVYFSTNLDCFRSNKSK
jgi:hypothetical protein